jgi:aryl-phospho-beta-D-glucosidase BglC (GH1 family)
MCIGLLSAVQIAYAYPFTLKNNTSFYIYSKESGAGCPAVIKPHDTATVSEYWCGFIACATDQYSETDGCLEWNSDKSSLVQGGYATWFSISFGSNLCTVPDGNTYSCQYDSASGNYSLDYASIVQKYSAGPSIGQPVELPTIKKYSTALMYRGINISGMEYDGTFLDALYQHPDIPDIQYFTQQGMNTIRIPIRWEFLVVDQSDNLVESHNPSSTAINTMYLKSVIDTTQKYLSHGVNVILDMHNYMRFCPTGISTGQANEPTDPVTNHCTLVNQDQLAQVWGLLAANSDLAALAKQYPNQLMFGLMNEPNSMDGTQGQELKTNDLFNAEVAALKEIRKNNLNNLVILSGNYWDPLHGWANVSPSADAPNGKVFTAANLANAGITDLSNVAIEMHQYFDSDYSGRSATCNYYSSYDDFKRKLQIEENSANDLGKWMKDNHMKVLLTEFGAADNATCQQDLNYMLQYLSDHAYDASTPTDGGFVGWTAWRGNRHGGNAGYSPFNYLQQANYTVYGAQGSESNSPAGTGITQGLGNGLMSSVFSNYLK